MSSEKQRALYLIPPSTSHLFDENLLTQWSASHPPISQIRSSLAKKRPYPFAGSSRERVWTESKSGNGTNKFRHKPRGVHTVSFSKGKKNSTSFQQGKPRRETKHGGPSQRKYK